MNIAKIGTGDQSFENSSKQEMEIGQDSEDVSLEKYLLIGPIVWGSNPTSRLPFSWIEEISVVGGI